MPCRWANMAAMPSGSTFADLNEVSFREAVPADAGSLLTLKQKLDCETSFMLVEPGERAETAEEVAADLERRIAATNSVVIVAEVRSRLVGYVDAVGGAHRRDSMTGYVVLGVLSAAAGRGVGGGLLDRLGEYAATHGLHRLELTVMATNHRAIQLYERKGYQREGRRRECLTVDGALVDELYMGNLIRPAGLALTVP